MGRLKTGHCSFCCVANDGKLLLMAKTKELLTKFASGGDQDRSSKLKFGDSLERK
jgi:hypothetical protein